MQESFMAPTSVGVTARPKPATLLAATIPMILPVLNPGQRKVLDLGCGANRTLCELPLPTDAVRVGLDVDAATLQVAHRDMVDVHFAAGDAHVLPFRSGYFDLVISKVTFPLLDIPVALREVHRILRPGGQVWMTLHPFVMTGMRILTDVKTGRIQDAVYQGYVIVNGLMLEYTGRQFRFPLNRRRVESFQTVRGITRALLRGGFTDVRFEMRRRGPGYEAQDRRLGAVFAVAASRPGTQEAR
jgi:ubiquinone/menaquinone biosynthesis C-methylase UbiE